VYASDCLAVKRGGRWAINQTADSPEAGEVNDADPSALTGISSPTDGDARTELQWPSCAPWPVPPTNALIPISTTGDADCSISRQIFISTIAVWAIALISIGNCLFLWTYQELGGGAIGPQLPTPTMLVLYLRRSLF
jgi:hypothetical protein